MANGEIVVENLSKEYPGGVVAVEDVSLRVEAGRIFGFLGPNGAGKSTTIKILTTLALPSGGRATVGGYDVVSQAEAVRRIAGVALQDIGLDPLMKPLELLALQTRLFGATREQARLRGEELLRLMRLTEAADRRVGTYSGGMRRRLDLALALAHEPRVLFLDEPTTGLDPASRRDVWDEVRRLNRELGMTIFLTTQYLEEADELADRVGIISHGKLAVEDTPTALKRQLGNDLIVVEVEHAQMELAESTLAGLEGTEGVEMRGHELLVGTPNGAALLSPVAIALGKADLKVLSLTLRTPTLDDVFVSVTGERLAGDDDDQDDVESE